MNKLVFYYIITNNQWPLQYLKLRKLGDVKILFLYTNCFINSKLEGKLNKKYRESCIYEKRLENGIFLVLVQILNCKFCTNKKINLIHIILEFQFRRKK